MKEPSWIKISYLNENTCWWEVGGECPNGDDCVTCDILDSLIKERAIGYREGLRQAKDNRSHNTSNVTENVTLDARDVYKVNKKSVAILSSPNPDLRTPYADKLLLDRIRAGRIGEKRSNENAGEAVAALDDGTTVPASDGIFEALAAIDALREETK